jgi:hypothetical protein
MTTYWITKYALTIGIKPLENVEADKDGYLSNIKTRGNFGSREWEHQHHFYRKNDWHVSKTGAIAKAEEMRDAKITSLKKQIAKLEKMKF